MKAREVKEGGCRLSLSKNSQNGDETGQPRANKRFVA
jgi:hypothetical protein